VPARLAHLVKIAENPIHSTPNASAAYARTRVLCVRWRRVMAGASWDVAKVFVIALSNVMRHTSYVIGRDV